MRDMQQGSICAKNTHREGSSMQPGGIMHTHRCAETTSCHVGHQCTLMYTDTHNPSTHAERSCRDQGAKGMQHPQKHPKQGQHAAALQRPTPWPITPMHDNDNSLQHTSTKLPQRHTTAPGPHATPDKPPSAATHQDLWKPAGRGGHSPPPTSPQGKYPCLHNPEAGPKN